MSPIKNPTTFFAYIRRAPFGGRLTQGQIDGVNAILDAWEYFKLTDHRWLANILAQVFHETGGRILPVRETFASTDKAAIANLEKAWKAGKLSSVKTPYWREGWFGRGQIQITHKANYLKLGQRLGVDLVKNPAKTLDPVIGARIAIVGMAEGLFTGKKLGDFFSHNTDDPVGARAIVNGSNKAKLIATYHKAFLDAIEAARGAVDAADALPEAAIADDVKPAESSTVMSLLGGTVGTAGMSALLGVNNPWGFGIAALVLLLGAGAGYMFLSGRWSVNRIKGHA
ncbi:glycoside hydrolase family 19 protein [Rhizobium sp. RU36D]|uniref:glycoside hydrolase family 19 protein n=1 Tax=Rhizobium sp. RU36D TaxID=1907415 RepID=UPI0009D846B4|nr:glycoside hydrolase family 19 protein [Rhizobium sp. RU36D]SMD02464.1 Chitinase class I [Rhizobium sp. RU36D]